MPRRKLQDGSQGAQPAGQAIGATAAPEANVAYERGISAKEVAAFLGISPRTVWAWTQQGKIRAYRLTNKKTVWFLNEIRDFRDNMLKTAFEKLPCAK